MCQKLEAVAPGVDCCSSLEPSSSAGLITTPVPCRVVIPVTHAKTGALHLTCLHNVTGLLACAGIALVAHLLQQRQPKHLTIDLLHAMEALLRAVGPSEGLHTAVLQRLLLNLRLWAAAPLLIQHSFQALLLKLAKVRVWSVPVFWNCPQLRPCMVVQQAALHGSTEVRHPTVKAVGAADFGPVGRCAAAFMSRSQALPLRLARTWGLT